MLQKNQYPDNDLSKIGEKDCKGPLKDQMHERRDHEGGTRELVRIAPSGEADTD